MASTYLTTVAEESRGKAYEGSNAYVWWKAKPGEGWSRLICCCVVAKVIGRRRRWMTTQWRHPWRLAGEALLKSWADEGGFALVRGNEWSPTKEVSTNDRTCQPERWRYKEEGTRRLRTIACSNVGSGRSGKVSRQCLLGFSLYT